MVNHRGWPDRSAGSNKLYEMLSVDVGILGLNRIFEKYFKAEDSDQSNQSRTPTGLMYTVIPHAQQRCFSHLSSNSESVISMLRPSARFLNACRLTLFTRPNCKLCDDAKLSLSQVWDKRPFDYEEIEVMKPGKESWKNVYEFDTPVVSTLDSNWIRH